jgi:hypothetical protein
MSLQLTSIPILKYKNENCITVADDVAIATLELSRAVHHLGITDESTRLN